MGTPKGKGVIGKGLTTQNERGMNNDNDGKIVHESKVGANYFGKTKPKAPNWGKIRGSREPQEKAVAGAGKIILCFDCLPPGGGGGNTDECVGGIQSDALGRGECFSLL